MHLICFEKDLNTYLRLICVVFSEFQAFKHVFIDFFEENMILFLYLYILNHENSHENRFSCT